LSFEPEQDVFRKVVEQTYLPEGWRAAVLDGSRLIVARSYRHRELYGRPATAKVWYEPIGPQGFVDTIDLEGRDSLTSYHRSQLSNWLVLMWAPKSVLNAPLYWSLVVAAALAFLTLVASIGAGLLAGRVVS